MTFWPWGSQRQFVPNELVQSGRDAKPTLIGSCSISDAPKMLDI